jgi:hypothetical protein
VWLGVQIRNVAVTGKAALQQSAGQLMKESSELQQNLQSTLDRFAVVQRDADLVEANVIDNVPCPPSPPPLCHP